MEKLKMIAKMRMLKLKISNKSRHASRWIHTEIVNTPDVRYHFNEGTNWKATDARLSGRKSEVYKFETNYWEQSTIDPTQNKYHYIGPNKNRRIENFHRHTTNLALYERQLEAEIEKAVGRLNKRWAEKFKTDFENHFEDDLVKFVKSK
jgi:hypothetical protein